MHSAWKTSGSIERSPVSFNHDLLSQNQVHINFATIKLKKTTQTTGLTDSIPSLKTHTVSET